MEYNFKDIEKKWQKYWVDNKTYKVDVDHTKPKYYVLDMFPYPSGAGLHVGHPLGYIASDIFSRYKRMSGFNVLHPMGYDAYGLPAEQYAIQTGQHPSITTNNNIKRYREQLDKIGFSYDWDREVRTCDPKYYKWTQWVFIQLFKHWYNNKTQKAEPISYLIKEFEKNGNKNIDAACSEIKNFDADKWIKMSEKEQQEVLLKYRLAYLDDAMVNWCPELGTVLANDEVKDGQSVRGGCTVVQKKMRQWSLRISAYSQRLLDGLDKINWTESLKEIQKNWIGKSVGAEMYFSVQNSDITIEIFTTRPDTIYGCTFMVLAPENTLVEKFTTPEYSDKIKEYINATKKRTERERIADIKTISGQFTGSYAINPFSKELLPIWISDYVLLGYGTGAIMSVPAHDSRDYAFAKHFNLPIVEVISGGDISEESYDSKDGILINSDLINGLDVPSAIEKINNEIEKRNLGYKKTNYRLRDAIFGRQRYWGEPFPVYFKDNMPYTIDENELPLELPEIDKYLPTEKGNPPLGRAKNWKNKDGYPFELSTMPGFAGSSAYYTRYMDSCNDSALVSKEANNYWQDVDLYMGGTEHATGHLIYSRFWNKFLYDIGIVCKDEPFKKLVNQGMIQGRSNFVYRLNVRKYAEFQIWDRIKENKTDYKFIKDKRFDNEIYDFYCEELNLVVELKGHNLIKEHYDKHNKSLKNDGINLIVVSYEEIVENIDKVINNIKDALNKNSFESYLKKDLKPIYLFASLNKVCPEYQATELHVDINLVNNDVLDIEAFKKWRPEYENVKFLLEDGKYICGHAVEKMSKSLYNVVNPDNIIDVYGADTLRLYEMFLGPIEQSKPWDTKGIDGVHRFLRKLWRLFHDDKNNINISDEEPVNEELKIIHKTIKKITEDIERFSFNTSVSAFMICVNELTDLKCNKRKILEDLVLLLAPFAPHISEELWSLAGYNSSITTAKFPKCNEKYLIENTYNYPVSFNGKMRFTMEFSLELSNKEIEEHVLQAENAQKWLQGKTPKKVIIVPKKIINIVV
ncbi:MAG: leucine--tRNA ligase [Bacteroidales bacterium]|nr:leucine--tRNA ligase [Bacteroidales bacterium]